MNKTEKWLNLGLGLYLAFLPWQTRLILDQWSLGKNFTEYATLSLYATDLILLAVFLVSLFLPGLYPTRHESHGESGGLAGQKKIKTAILALLIVIFGSIIFADQVAVVIFSIKVLIIGLILYSLLQQKWAGPRFLLACFLAGVILQAIIGIFQFIFQTTPVISWLGMASHDPGLAGTSVIEAGGMRWLRAYGSLPHPNILGGYLAVGLLVAFGFYLKIYEKVRAGFSRWTRENVKKHLEGRRWYVNQALKISGLVLAGAILTLGLLLTFSRSAWLGFAIAWLVILGVLLMKKIPWGWALWLKWTVFMAVVAIIIIAALPQAFLTRAQTNTRLEEQSVQVRKNLYQDAWTLIKKEPLRGVGYGNMVVAVYDRLDSGRNTISDYQPVHNIYVLSAVELGLIGGLVFLIFIFVVLKTAITKVFKAPSPEHLTILGMFICLLVIGFFDHYLWTLSAGVGIFWLVVGMISKEGFLAALDG